MTKRRVAVFLGAALAMLGAAQAAPAGILGVQVSPVPGHRAQLAADKGALHLEIAAPVGKAGLRASPAGASAAVSTPLLTTEAGLQTGPPRVSLDVAIKPRAEQSSPTPTHQVSTRRAVKSAQAKPAPAKPDRVSPTFGTTPAPGQAAPAAVDPDPRPLLPPSPLSEPASSGWTDLLSASPTGPGGATVALAGLLLVVLAPLAMTLRGPPRTLRPPRLSFVLQRPG